MLSTKLVRLIEEHWQPLTALILREIRGDERLQHIAGLPESEVRDRARDILEHLGHWLAASSGQELTRRFEHLGAQRQQEEIPLDEVVLAYLIIKDAMLDFVRGQGLDQSAVEVYAWEELEHAVGNVFDSMIYHVVRGYCAALTRHHTKAAAARR